MKPQIFENGFHREIFVSNCHELVGGLQTSMTYYRALFVLVTILMSLWRFLHQNIDLFQHCSGHWCCKVVRACFSECLCCFVCLFVCLYSWLCSRTSYAPVHGVCLCSSVLLWYVITPLTIGLAYILKRSHLWTQGRKGRTLTFLVAPI